MTSMDLKTKCLILFSGVLWSCVLGLQRPPPRYSQQYMPDTSFSCRNKIVGSYYADPETDCQLFHVCVSVAGSIQDYKFLCPNDTAFDQESQTCADWYDVDCEASTLYYASDNFDLYRIGSGLESLHYDSIRSDAEPQDHLQRSESNDPVRSSANNLNRVSNTDYNNNGKEFVRGNNNNNFYNRNNRGKTEEYDNDDKYKDENEDGKKKTGIRKVSRKQSFNGNNNNNDNHFTTSTTVGTSSNQNTYSGFYSNNNYNQRATNYVSSSTAGTTLPTTIRPQQDYRTQSTQRYNPVTSSTSRPPPNYQDTYNAYQSSSTTGRPIYNIYSTQQQQSSQQPQSVFYNQQSTTLKSSNNNYQSNPSTSYEGARQNNVYTQSTTLKPAIGYNANRNYQDQSQSTTIKSSTTYESNDFAHQQRNYNKILRANGNSGAYQTTAPPVTIRDTNYNNYNGNNNNNNNNNNKNGQYRTTGIALPTTIKQEAAQTTARYYPNYAISYTPTTYSPPITNNANNKKYSNDNNNGQYYEKSTGSGAAALKSSTQQHYDSTKAPKKATQYNNYDQTGKYYETSTGSSNNNYDFGRSAGIGFSPASINHLAETPRSTTPVPRSRGPTVSNPTTYNPNNFNSNAQRTIQQSTTTPRTGSYVSGSARPFSSTTRFPDSSTTIKPIKNGRKNDYDYAYYDTGAPLEYDGLDLEQVTGNKESTKITRSSN